MAIPVEVFSSTRGVFVAAPAGCALFGAQSLSLEHGSRSLSCVLADGARLDVGRLPAGAVEALQAVGHVPIVAFELGGVSEAVMLPLTLSS